MAITMNYNWFHGQDLLANNLFTFGDQTTPAVTSNFAGDRYMSAWSDPNNTWQIEERIVAVDKSPYSDEFTVNNSANLGTVQYDPSVAGLAGGNFVVTYTDYATDAGGDIRARLFSSTGVTLGSDFTIDASGFFDDHQSSVAGLSNGGFVVTYTRDGAAGNIGIRARVFDANGVDQSAIIVVDPGSQQQAPSVAALSTGGFVVAWQDDSDDSVYFRRYQNDGVALDAGRVLIDTTGSINEDIHVVGLPGGGFAVAYADSGWSISGTEISFRIYNADGTPRTGFIQANAGELGGIETNYQNLPTITTMGDLIVVGWRDVDSYTAQVQVFDAQGNAVGDNISLAENVTEFELAGLGNGLMADVRRSTVTEGAGLADSIRTNVSHFVRTQAGDGADNTIVGVDDSVHERLFGSGGNDRLIGGQGGDELFGGDGSDTVSYETALTGVTANLTSPWLNTGDAAGDFYSSIERVTGSAFNDTLVGDDGSNMLKGGGGNDTLIGAGAVDWIDGGAGDDTAVFSLNFNDYVVMDYGAKIVVRGADGVATLSSVEHMQFADTTITPAAIANDGDPLFDTLYYLSRNADVFQAGVNARDHFNAFGWHEDRDPNAYFDTSGYLAINDDVAAAGLNPLQHYHQAGWQLGRDPSVNFDTTLYLLNNPDVAAAGTDPLAHFLQFGWAEGRTSYAAIGQTIVNGFDAEYYLWHNPDVAAAGVDPLQHYNAFGWHEGRNPNGWFDTAGYLSHYGDVAAAGVNPLEHYMTAGWQEGRDPSWQFDTAGYLAANPDVAAVGINPLQHYLQNGIYEGRSTASDGVWG